MKAELDAKNKEIEVQPHYPGFRVQELQVLDLGSTGRWRVRELGG